ncbi:MAG: prepilin-type N-terminal cleavage/methylation domain-containing protein [Planctomycetaceae bacterium]|nr:prepilin-type N-terminal cleavage/methylation domain-containing protein [Planctomycetaceae bacterium]
MEHRKTKCADGSGFTLIELIVVIVILSIAALVAVPMMSSAADMQVRSAANRIAADMDYAKNLAMTHQKAYTLVFNPSAESYDLRETATDAVISDPMRTSESYAINFTADSRLSQVDIVSADFDSDVSNAVTFNYVGCPYRGKGLTDALAVGRITLRADNFTLYVDIEPVTGYVTITGL